MRKIYTRTTRKRSNEDLSRFRSLQIKVRPAVVITETKDKYSDIVLAAISSQVPPVLNTNEMLLTPNENNGLRITSVVKVDRLLTIKSEKIIATLGSMNNTEVEEFRRIFRSLAN